MDMIGDEKKAKRAIEKKRKKISQKEKKRRPFLAGSGGSRPLVREAISVGQGKKRQWGQGTGGGSSETTGEGPRKRKRVE